MKFRNTKMLGIVGDGMSTTLLCNVANRYGVATTLLEQRVSDLAGMASNEQLLFAASEDNIVTLSLRCDKIIVNSNLEFKFDKTLHADVYPYKAGLNRLCNRKDLMEFCNENDIPFVDTEVIEAESKLERKAAIVNLIKEHAERCREHDEMLDRTETFIPIVIDYRYNEYTRSEMIFSYADAKELIESIEDAPEGYYFRVADDTNESYTIYAIIDEQKQAFVYDAMSVNINKENNHVFELGNKKCAAVTDELREYNEKLINWIAAPGVYAIRYEKNYKNEIKLMDVSTQLGIGIALTEKGYNVSIAEQYIRLILGLPVIKPILVEECTGIVEKVDELAPEDIGQIYKICPSYAEDRDYFLNVLSGKRTAKKTRKQKADSRQLDVENALSHEDLEKAEASDIQQAAEQLNKSGIYSLDKLFEAMGKPKIPKEAKEKTNKETKPKIKQETKKESPKTIHEIIKDDFIAETSMELRKLADVIVETTGLTEEDKLLPFLEKLLQFLEKLMPDIDCRSLVREQIKLMNSEQGKHKKITEQKDKVNGEFNPEFVFSKEEQNERDKIEVKVEKPKRRPPRRKATEVAEEEIVKEEIIKDEADTEKKPQKRPTRKRRAEEEMIKDGTENEEKPKKRASRKKKAEVTEEEIIKDDSMAEEKPKRRATHKKKEE